MTLRIFLIITAIVSAAFGSSFLLVPKLMADLYGIPFSVDLAMMDRFFGAALIGLGLFSWALKDLTETALIPKVLLAHGLHDLIGFVVAFYYTTTHVLNALGWLSVFVYAAFAVGCILVYRARNATVGTLRPA